MINAIACIPWECVLPFALLSGLLVALSLSAIRGAAGKAGTRRLRP